jgi:uncharacterized repeat protein (TIGR02543 family)
MDVGGNFTDLTTTTYNNSNIAYTVLADVNDNIYIGGQFLNVSGVSANRIAYYDSSPTTYSVTYHAIDVSGSVPVDTTLYSSGQVVTVLDKGNLVNTGYTFAGWNTSADGTGTNYSPPASFTITGDTILYAQWNANSVPCFKEGSKILVFENGEEKYVPVETLRKGMLVKTLLNGYVPVNIIGTSTIFNPGNDRRIKHRLYACKKEHFPELTEGELVLTGCHSILVDHPSEIQIEETKEMFGKIYVTDSKFRLIACFDDRAEPYKCEGTFNIYHLALDNENYYGNYGIYANGLLVESCSKRYLSELSNMKLIE